MPNATFYAFKPSGKWKYEGRGNLSSQVFKVFNTQQRRNQILFENAGVFPGMSTKAEDLTWVVIPDEDHETGFPLMLLPTNGEG